jgi:glycosyltransferase involved in cell wall biosynthesis
MGFEGVQVRVIYFTRSYNTHDHRFLASLAGAGLDVFYLPLESAVRQQEARPLPPGVKRIEWRGGQSPAHWVDYPTLIQDMKRVIREVKPDIIHAGPVHRSAFVAAAAGFHPLLTMSWAADILYESEHNPWMHWASSYTLSHTDILAGDCRAVENKAAEYGFPRDKVVLFPWGIDLQKFQPGRNNELRRQLGWQDEFIVLSLRSWEPIYGVDIVLKAFAQASRQVPQLRLLLPGGGSQKERIRQLIQEYHLEELVKLPGQVGQEQLPDYYHAADLYLTASHSDGSSVTLMEALACGLPAAVSDIAGNVEWVQPDQQGWVFHDGDAAGAAQCIVKAYQERERRATMQAANRRLAEQRADWDKNFNVLLGAYDRAVALAGNK